MQSKYWKRWIPSLQICLMAILWVGLLLPGPVWAKHEKGHDEVSGICPQPRQTVRAPDEYLELKNPLETTPQNVLAGKTLFRVDAKPTACKVCHGISGDGLGILFHRVKT